MTWHEKLVIAGRMPMLSENVRDWRAVVHQVLSSLVMLASVHQCTQLVHDSVWDIKPMKLVVHEMSQTAIKFLCVTDNLQPVCCRLQ